MITNCSYVLQYYPTVLIVFIKEGSLLIESLPNYFFNNNTKSLLNHKLVYETNDYTHYLYGFTCRYHSLVSVSNTVFVIEWRAKLSQLLFVVCVSFILYNYLISTKFFLTDSAFKSETEGLILNLVNRAAYKVLAWPG